VNLFSVNKALKKGFKISNEGEAISFSKNHVSITFDMIYHTKGDDTVSGIMMQACSPLMVNQATNGFSFDKCIDVNKFHEMLGHCGADKLQKTAHIHGIRLKGSIKIC
jgi:hypothetical protein